MRQGGVSGTGAVIAALATLLGVAPAMASTPTPDVIRQPPDRSPPSVPTGRDFAGVRFSLAAESGKLEFHAARTDVWTETTASGPLTRLLLSGDVVVRLGAYEFAARNAAVWLQRLPTTDAPGPPNFQVFVYFDHVGTPGADAAVSVSADQLSVRAIIAPESGVQLVTSLRREGRPSDPILARAEDALVRALQQATERPPGAGPDLRPGVRPGSPESGIQLAPEGGVAQAEARTSAEVQQLFRTLPPEPATAPIFAKGGVLSVSTGHWTLVTGEQESAFLISGGVTVEYDELRAGKSLQITAERAVIFLSPGKASDLAHLTRDNVRGIYLEGDVVAVASGGRYTLRGPRLYYDMPTQKAVIVDAVFWTYDQARRLPIYLRADIIRQEAERQFTAESATIATTGFFDPVLSLGATSLTITGVPRTLPEGAPAGTDQMSYFVDASNVTLRAGPIPFFYTPVFAGYPEQIPLRDLRMENSSGSGAALKSTWNLYGLLGLDRPDNVNADLLVDGYFQRGLGGGTRAAWQDQDYKGAFFAYGLPSDSGTDILKPGTKIERDDQARGILLGEHLAKVDDHWTVQLEGSIISDESFIDAFFESLGETHREFTNLVSARRTEENTQLVLGAKGTFNDFIANEYLLQTPGYVVDKLPEVSYTRQADDLLGAVAPGLLSYFSEYRYSRMKMSFDEPFAFERGFSTDALAQRAFGINATQSIEQRLRAQGLNESAVNRFDTRQELRSPLAAGPLNITPFAVGRFTAYDSEFEDFSPGEGDRNRIWGSVGAAASTSVQAIDDSADSRLFDVHRLRHIVEPHASVMVAGTNVDRVDLPIYDRGVEDIAEGTLSNVGLSQTVQTQRGGPGRWHSVDLLKLNTDFSFGSDDADRTYPIGRWVEYRPELSNVGNFMTNELTYQLSDSLTFVGSSIYDLDAHQQSRSNAGIIVEHWPGFRTSFEIRNVHPDASTYFDVGAAYEMTSKYTLAGNANFDINQGGIQTVSVEIRRRLPGLLFGVGVSYNDITNETSLGFVFQPEGTRGSGARLKGLGTSDDRTRTNGIGGP